MAKKPTSRKPTAAQPARPASVVRKPLGSHQEPARAPATKANSTKAKSSSAVEAELAKIDRDVLKLINRRAQLTTEAIQAHDNPTQAMFNPLGDDRLYAELEQQSPGPLPGTAVRAIYREILSAARRKVKPLRVAYLGPSYSFSHLAAIERFGRSTDLVPVSTIAAVFEEVNRGHAQYGVVPIENSTDGRIVDTLDMFTRLPLRICGEVQLAIHHNLMSRCPRGEITEIYSKPQALSQCREWLARNMPQCRLIEVTSTSDAARLARDKHGVGAVASQQAAVEYDIQIVAENIEDNTHNVTRFAVIGEEISKPSGADRTAVLLQIPHKPGTLSDALQLFKNNKINLTWIESFPLRGPEVGYLFFLDFEGHVGEARIKKALAELESKAVRMEVLGSYPRSEPRE